MSTNVERAFQDLKRSLDNDRLAHAYLVIGDPRGDALELACRFVACLLELPDASASVDYADEGTLPSHSDLLWLRPRKKARTIPVDDVRDMNKRMNWTSFEGGWKAGVVLAADRMSMEAANASLKTLEEPPRRSCMLLVTDSPEHILPTIHSRCQRIFLSSGQQVHAGAWTETLLDLLRTGPPEDALQAMQSAIFLEELLTAAAKEIADGLDAGEDEDDEVFKARVAAKVLELREDLLRCLQFWFRDLLVCVHGGTTDLLYFGDDEAVLRKQASRLDPAKALANMEAVEGCIRRVSRHLPVVSVFESTWVQFGRIALS